MDELDETLRAYALQTQKKEDTKALLKMRIPAVYSRDQWINDEVRIRGLLS